MSKFSEEIKLLITSGINLNAQDELGETILHKAIDKQDIKAINMLIKAKANLNIQDKYGITPLKLAMFDINILKLLLEAGADANIPEKFGYTPLMEAVYKKPEDEQLMMNNL